VTILTTTLPSEKKRENKMLYKTTIVIWTDLDPSTTSLEDLGRDATSGDSYCSKQETVLVKDETSDPDWDGTEFFGSQGETYNSHSDDTMDGDHDSAMASAGMGTDEDYGFFGDDNE